MDQIIARCPGYNCNFVCYNDEDIKNLRIHFGKTKHNLHPFMTTRNVSENIRRSVFSLKEYAQRKDREPVIGLEYILEYKLQLTPNDKTETKYFCEICEFDSDLIPMLEHLSDFKHQKLYLTKVYPYVLKAPSSRREDRTQFMKRMTKEIEKEVGTKIHKTDSVIRTVPMINKQSKRKSRWDSDLQKRMKKALDYLESFEIDNACEAATVTRLIDKLTAELKFHSDKLKDEALFPAKVARAKDVASLLMQNTSKARLAPKNPQQKPQKSRKGFIKPPPSLTKPPPSPKNTNSRKNVNIPRGSLQTTSKKTHLTPTPAASSTYAGSRNAAAPPVYAGARNAAAPPVYAGARNAAAPPVYAGARNAAAPPVFAGARNAAAPPMYAGAPNGAPPMYAGAPNATAPPMYAGAPNAAAPPMYAAAQSTYPQNPQEFQTAKSNLEPQIDQTATEDLKFVKKLKALLGVLSQNSDNSQNTINTMQPDNSRNAKLQLLKSLLLNKTAKPGNTPANQLGMQMASLTQDMANSENVSLNQQLTILATRNNSTMAQFSQNILMNMAPTAQNAYPVGNAMNMAALLGNNQVNANPFFPGNQYAQNHGYGQMDNSALMLMNQTSFQHPHMGQQPGFNSMSQSNGNFGYDGLMADNYGNSQMSGYGNIARQGVSNAGVNQSYNDYGAKQLPYSRDSENERFENTGHDTDLRESVSPAPTNNLTVDLLKRIKGKDPFTVSAILSEYAEHLS